MSSDDRRAPGTSRMPFEGLVEVGGALGPAFEAQAVNVSEDGMMLRTAYLPEAGQPLTCRFDAGRGTTVLASGEVVWTQAAEKGGEFAIRFTDLDPESIDALKRLCGLPVTTSEAGEPAPAPNGSKVRLHIEGLASPMRAKIKDSGSSEIRVGSDLGFLQVGKPLELEDAGSGAKRPACIDHVEVEVDPSSHIPQLVVTLRYADAPSAADSDRVAAPRPSKAECASKADDLAAVEEASLQMKGAVARNIARVGPAIEQFAHRAKKTVELLAKRSAERTDDGASPRRTTAPAPGGGLHAAGKRVVRGEASSATDEKSSVARRKLNKRNAVLASAVMLAAVVGALGLKKAHHEGAAEPNAAASTNGSVAPAMAPSMSAVVAAQSAPVAAPSPVAASNPESYASTSSESTGSDDDGESLPRSEHHKHRVTPFGNGPVHHGNVLRIKMDSAIESIEGAQQPTGFTVKLPGRHSLEAAAPLAARDERIAAIKMANEAGGAELTLTFKDGVPNYQVSARGDTLIVTLAPVGDLDKTVARKEKADSAPKHHKASHKKD